MRKFALTCATLAALLLVAVLGLGLYGQNSAAQTKENLAEETAIAENLAQVKAAAENEQAGKIAQLAQEKLDQLPETSRKLAAKGTNSTTSLAASLTASTNELIDTAFSTDDAALRVFLLESATELWEAGVTEEIVEGTYPTALADRVTELEVCSPAENQAEAPASLALIMTTLDELTYAASLFAARADVDGYTESQTTEVNNTNTQAALWQSRTNDALSCTYKLPARKAAYQVESTDPQATLAALKTQVQDAVEAAIADPTVTDDLALTELLVLQKNFK